MQHITSRLCVTILAFVVGVIGVWLSGLYSKFESIVVDTFVSGSSDVADSSAIIPPKTGCDVTQSSDEYPTTGSFEQFWSEFRSAVEAGDKRRLFLLSDVCRFHWNGSDLRLKNGLNHYQRFETESDFVESYNRMFTDEIKNQILKNNPRKVSYEYQGKEHHFYSLDWQGDFSYSLTFTNNGAGYKFSGLSLGPPE